MTEYKMPDPPDDGGTWRWKVSKSWSAGSIGFGRLKLQARSFGIWWTVESTAVELDGTPEVNAANCCYAGDYLLDLYRNRLRRQGRLDVNGLEGVVHGHGITGSKS
ncbi:hypothetical protein BH762_gp088 [Gordonia phage OneUp]|uniref:Uncharacterized protein n=1 Tax=Gordonia phage OneUp TaxID=1838074 RepID=A0A160DEY4_9CAUD|nr:hypothetical protein BH762_gp088 [Gordonia phage OneUp]ANA86431.1 hypothetical protein PBI_ONEUP_97 [Gordonia phage OneUp]